MKKILFIMFALMTTTWAYVNSQMDLFTDDAEVHPKAGEHARFITGTDLLIDGGVIASIRTGEFKLWQ